MSKVKAQLFVNKRDQKAMEKEAACKPQKLTFKEFAKEKLSLKERL